MSAKNYLSAQERNKFDCLPSINQKFACRSELPPLSANTNAVFNRNLGYKFDIKPYISKQDQSFTERPSSPYSDFPSESETGTPDFLSEESDSSVGSALRQSTAEATRALVEEWDRIERTLYDEPGDKCTRPALLEECRQWQMLHPQLRVVGKAIRLPDKKPGYRAIEFDEVIAMHYSDYDQFSESEERLSQSSTDVTPQNSPRPSMCNNLLERQNTYVSEEMFEPKLSREKMLYIPTQKRELKDPQYPNHELPDKFCSLLHIRPLGIRSPPQKKRPPSILRSELASSRWMRNQRPDSTRCDRNSAKSFVSLDIRSFEAASSASERNKVYNNRLLTAKHKDLAKLQPLHSPDIPPHDTNRYFMSTTHRNSMRKVSLPPLLLEEERRKVSAVESAKKHKPKKYTIPRSGYHFDKTRANH